MASTSGRQVAHVSILLLSGQLISIRKVQSKKVLKNDVMIKIFNQMYIDGIGFISLYFSNLIQQRLAA